MLFLFAFYRKLDGKKAKLSNLIVGIDTVNMLASAIRNDEQVQGLVQVFFYHTACPTKMTIYCSCSRTESYYKHLYRLIPLDPSMCDCYLYTRHLLWFGSNDKPTVHAELGFSIRY